MDFLFSSAYAQTAAAAPAQPNPIMAFLPFVVILVVFYFLLIRPQKKKMQQEVKMLAALQKGDEVVTKAGIIGTIYGLTDSVVTLEIADNARMKVLRSQVAGPLAAAMKEEAAATKK